MKYIVDAYIDWFLDQHGRNHRQAMAWLIGRMNAAERELQRVYEGVDHPKANDYTTIGYIERELDEKEEK